MEHDARRRSQRLDRTVLRKEFGLSASAKRWLTVGILLFALLSWVVYVHLYSSIRQTALQQSERNLANISELNASVVSRSLESRLLLLKAFSNNLPDPSTVTVDKLLQRMAIYADLYQFHSIGILTPDLTLYRTDGKVLDVAGVPQYREAFGFESRISNSFLPPDGSSQRVNLFSSPVVEDDQIRFVITATYLSVDATNRINISALGGRGYTFLLNTSGDVVIYSASYENPDYVALMKHINETAAIAPDESGTATFTYEGDSYRAYFEDLDVNDWFLMTCAREKDLYAETIQMLWLVVLGMDALGLLILLLLAFTLYLCFRFQRKSQQAVYYDSLLGIRNGAFLQLLYQLLPAKRLEHMAFVIFDIDKFKEYNYLYGEDAGDDLLRYIAGVFQQELPTDLLFRYLSDHFVLLMECSARPEAEEKIRRVLNHIARDIESSAIQPFDLSVGIRMIRRNEPMRLVLSDALVAKGTVKGIQIQQYAFYDEELRMRRLNYMEMESDFHKALRDGEFHVYYQPKIDMRNGHIVGAEALVRWIKADGRIISPNDFIPCFEESRQVVLLDEAVLESVCRQMVSMEADGIAVRPVSVNLSRVHLMNKSIQTKIETILKESGVNPANLAFEITERAVNEESIPLKEIIGFLHKLGCKVNLDDYGVGVSGPNTLATNAFDVIKLDKSFVSRIGHSKMEAMIRSTIHLSVGLGMEIIAEGVEEKYQADALVSWGCNYAQGYLYSPPVPEPEYRRMLMENANRLA